MAVINDGVIGADSEKTFERKLTMKYLITFLLAFSIAILPMQAQKIVPQTTTTIPAKDVAELQKPFLGDWQILSCAPNNTSVAIQASIKPGAPGIDPTDIYPQFFLQTLYSPTGTREFEKPLQFITYAFLHFTATYNPVVLLEVTNGPLLLSITPQKNGTLFGQVETKDGNQYDAFLIHPTGTIQNFYDKYIGLCTDQRAADKFYGRTESK